MDVWMRAGTNKCYSGVKSDKRHKPRTKQHKYTLDWSSMCVVRLYWFLNWIEKKCAKLLTTLEKNIAGRNIYWLLFAQCQFMRTCNAVSCLHFELRHSHKPVFDSKTSCICAKCAIFNRLITCQARPVRFPPTSHGSPRRQIPVCPTALECILWPAAHHRRRFPSVGLPR